MNNIIHTAINNNETSPEDFRITVNEERNYFKQKISIIWVKSQKSIINRIN